MKCDAEARAALEELAALWMRQQEEYPRDFGGQEAAAAVRCCCKEVRSLLLRMESEPVCEFCQTLPDGVVVSYCGSCQALRNEASR